MHGSWGGGGVVSEGFPVVGVVCRNYYDMVLFCFPADSTMATVSTAGSTMATASTAGSTMATVSIVTLVLVTFLTMLFV